MSDDLKKELQATTLPQIGGYNGDYTDEDYVFDVFRRALDRIEELERRLREWATNEETARREALEEAARACTKVRVRLAAGMTPEGARYEYEQAIRALMEPTPPSREP